ncbi:hypothetical protein CWI84_01480 [Idiomarina tyrosinivorans]|uniref:PTS EIIA type-1 domain-containing protein n=1 Tax=Idiomarina tyrosinivorans TaxID=1445662 RepID=A0A432ZU65_9GAMM|nr:PTS glucose transporter subunit IIA [Idiomarina tyrosinivorans]RUO81457.1 hypothetical protein CWI84_01480 [Idiomarina tyrosinivorans]
MQLFAPVNGRLCPPTSHPSAIIRHGFAGQGITLTVTGNEIFAPCDATIIQSSAAGHYWLLQTPQGDSVTLLLGQVEQLHPACQRRESTRNVEHIAQGELLARVNTSVLRSLPAAAQCLAIYCDNPHWQWQNISRIRVGEKVAQFEDGVV